MRFFMKRFTIVVLLLFVNCGLFSLAQSPIRIQYENRAIPAPAYLNQIGIYSYDYILHPPYHVYVNLYDDASTLISTITITENIAGNNAILKLKYPQSETEEWITISEIKRDSHVQCTTQFSNGKKVESLIELQPNFGNSKAIPVKSVRLDCGRTVTILNEMSSSENIQHSVENIVNSCITTSALSTLYVVGRNIRDLSNIALMVLPVVGSEATVDDMSCKVTCFRMPLFILPMFNCDGGTLHSCNCDRGLGVFFMDGCGFFLLPCVYLCSEFPGGPIG